MDDTQAITEAAAAQTFLNTSGAAVALANIGNEYIVYNDAGASFNMTIPSGGYTRRWFNPSTGAFQTPTTFTVSGSSETYPKPDTGVWVRQIQTPSANIIIPTSPVLTVK